MTPRNGSVPFCWADKRVLRKIRASFDSQNVAATALAAYHALTEAASNQECEEFTETIPAIANLAGLSVRTTGDRLHDLARIGVIKISTPKMKAPSTYTLLPFGNGCATLGNGCRTFGKREAPRLPSLEEQKNRTDRERGVEVELPKGFPKTEEEAAKAASAVGCNDQFARETWNKAMGRGGCDAKDVPIRSWPHYLASEWKFERQRLDRDKATGKSKSKERDHSKGFFDR